MEAQYDDETGRLQLAIVKNKTQLMAALRLVINCPADLRIIMKHKNGPDTEMLIYGAPIEESVIRLEDIYYKSFRGPIRLNGDNVNMVLAVKHERRIRAAIRRVSKIPADELFN
jgi:hypothetical protein